MSGNKSMSGTSYSVSWDATDYDTNTFRAAGNPTRLTVPSGVSYLQLVGGTAMTAHASTACPSDVRRGRPLMVRRSRAGYSPAFEELQRGRREGEALN